MTQPVRRQVRDAGGMVLLLYWNCVDRTVNLYMLVFALSPTAHGVIFISYSAVNVFRRGSRLRWVREMSNSRVVGKSDKYIFLWVQIAALPRTLT